MAKKRTQITQRNLKQPLLQKEIGSRCPYCTNEDIAHFQIHHIDENPDNHEYENLLMMCQLCHSKFTKKVPGWDFRKARDKKDEILKIADLRLFESNPLGNFDYGCHSMRKDDGRQWEEEENGSKANIKVVDPFHLEISLRHDNREWKGELVLSARNYGELTFIYQDEVGIEVGRRECYLKQKYTTEYREDIIFLKPLTNLKDYGDELIIRRTPCISASTSL